MEAIQTLKAPMNRRWSLLLAVPVMLLAARAHADVLCAGTSGAVKVRVACAANEHQLDPAALGMKATSEGTPVSFAIAPTYPATSAKFTVPAGQTFLLTDFMGGGGNLGQWSLSDSSGARLYSDDGTSPTQLHFNSPVPLSGEVTFATLYSQYIYNLHFTFIGRLVPSS
jgi:hypothetical protein